MTDVLNTLSDEQYINLETFKKNGEGVKTPVWFIKEDDRVFVITRSKTGKVKRLKNNPKVRICPCSFNGTPKGEWVSGTATKVEGDEAKRAISLRNKKYGFKAKLAGFLLKSKGDLVVYSLKLDHTDS